MKTKVGVSARHVHLTKEDFSILFGKDELTHLKDLHQIGQFAALETVTLKTDKSTIENVRIIGPLRSYNQIEISKTDAYKLGLNPPIRRSGEVSGSSPITIVGPVGQLHLEEGCIIADRHIHITPAMANEYNIQDKQRIIVKINTEKKGIIEAFAKISDDAYFELHLDTDDANAFLLKNDDEVEIEF
ncbi:MAG: phosphate propanoyltransferase [Bacilli bacterium]